MFKKLYVNSIKIQDIVQEEVITFYYYGQELFIRIAKKHWIDLDVERTASVAYQPPPPPNLENFI